MAIVAGLVLSGFTPFLDINPIQVYSSAIKTLFTDRYMAAEVFLKATPFIFTALAFAFTYKANLFNIGAQGQFYLGSVAAVSVSLLLDGKIPTAILLVVVFAATLLAGGLMGAGIGFLKARYNANEFLTSMMSTYVVLAFMNYLLRTVLKETKGEYPQTDALSEAAWIPRIVPGTRLHLGFVIAVITAILIWVFLYKTPLGFRIRAIGSNARAGELAHTTQNFRNCFLISGRLQVRFYGVNGVVRMLIQDFNPDLGSAGSARILATPN